MVLGEVMPRGCPRRSGEPGSGGEPGGVAEREVEPRPVSDPAAAQSSTMRSRARRRVGTFTGSAAPMPASTVPIQMESAPRLGVALALQSTTTMRSNSTFRRGCSDTEMPSSGRVEREARPLEPVARWRARARRAALLPAPWWTGRHRLRRRRRTCGWPAAVRRARPSSLTTNGRGTGCSPRCRRWSRASMVTREVAPRGDDRLPIGVVDAGDHPVALQLVGTLRPELQQQFVVGAEQGQRVGSRPRRGRCCRAAARPRARPPSPRRCRPSSCRRAARTGARRRCTRRRRGIDCSPRTR